MIDVSEYKLGETSAELQLESSDDNRAVALALARQARRGIDIFTRDLDRRVFDDRDFIEAIKHMAIGNSRALLRVIVQDSSRVAKQGHRLFHLGQEITSKIKFHKPGDEFLNNNETYMLVDGTGLLLRRQSERYRGSASFNDPQRVRELQAQFERAWEGSEPDPYLRRLTL
jgi:hypothetical protein